MGKEMAEQDNLSATLDRAMGRFASKTGITVESEESGMSNNKNQKTSAQKTAIHETGGDADKSSNAGAQNQTMKDAGDYGTQAEQVNKQKTETNAHAPDGTPENGTQQNTTNFKDESHPLGGSGGAAKLSKKQALAAVLAIAGEDPKAAAALMRSIVADGFYKQTDDVDLGPPLGGEPDSVADGEEEEESTTPEAAPEAAPAMDSTVPRLQDAVNDRQEALDVDRQVVEELNKVLEEVNAGKKFNRQERDTRRAASRRVTAADTRDKGDGKVPGPDEQGASKVPHASTDPSPQTVQDGDPDFTLFDQSKGKSKKTPESASGQETAPSADRDYVFSMQRAASKLRRQIIIAVKNRAERDNLNVDQKRAVLAMVMEKTASGKKYRALRNALKELGASMTTLTTPTKRPSQRTAADPSQTSIKDQTGGAGGADTNGYTGDEAGDKNHGSEIQDGNTSVLESPETASAVSGAQSKVDKDHRDATQGASVASLLQDKNRKGVEAKIEHLKRAAKVLSQYPEKVSVLNGDSTAAKQRIKVLCDKMVTTSRSMDVALKTKVTDVKSHNFAKVVGSIKNHVLVGNELLNAAKDVAFMVSAAEKSIKAASDKFSRVSPAFKLACQMVDMRQIVMSDLPEKVAEFINMTPSEFKVASNMATSIAKTAARRTPGVTGPRTLPSVHTATSGFGANAPQADGELEGIFDE